MKTLLLSICSCFIIGCSSHNDQSDSKEKVDATILRLSADTDVHVDVEHPYLEESKDEVDLAGKVDFNPNLVTKVYSLVNGTVMSVKVGQGDFVHRGDILAEIYSSDFATAVSDFQKANAQLKVAEKNYLRARELAEAKITSQRELQQAASDSAQARAEFDRSSRVLDLLNGSRDSSSSLFKIKAPIDGFILERFAQIGSQARSDNAQNLFTIGLVKNVWVILDVYQDQFQKISVGDMVALTFEGLDDSAVVSTIKYISPVIDQTTMTGKARCEVDNSSGKIKPAMFCSARVFHAKGKGLFIPASSTFYDGDGKTYVFAKLDTGKYQKREVQVGRKFPDKVEVVLGVSLADNIVTNQAIFLNEELQLSSK